MRGAWWLRSLLVLMQAFVSLTETHTHWLLSIAGTCVHLGNTEVRHRTKGHCLWVTSVPQMFTPNGGVKGVTLLRKKSDIFTRLAGLVYHPPFQPVGHQ